MTSRDYEIAKELKARLSAIVELNNFKVFGSRARGTHDEYSDMDVFIEVPCLDKELKGKMLDAAWEIGFKNGIVVSLLIYTQYEIEKSPAKSSPIIKNITEEGVAV